MIAFLNKDLGTSDIAVAQTYMEDSLRLARQEYRRRPKSRNRIGTLFGEIDLRRYLCEATDAGDLIVRAAQDATKDKTG